MDITALFNMSYGVYVVTSQNENTKAGCVANSSIQVTSQDPYMLVSLNKDNYTTDIILKSRKYAVSILTENASMDVIGTFGYQSSKDIDKFAGVDYAVIHDVPVLKSGANAYFVCDVVEVFEANTHLLILGKVVEAEKLNQEPSMTYAYYHQVKKGKSPKNAPTYVEETKTEEKEVWVCEICGYEYEGDLSKLDSYTCPICKMPKEKFHKK